MAAHNARMCSVGSDKSMSIAAAMPGSTMLGGGAAGGSALPGARRTAGGASRTMLGGGGSAGSPSGAPNKPGTGGPRGGYNMAEY